MADRDRNGHMGRHRADEQLALGIACGLTIEAAAQHANVSSKTAGRRLKEEAFLSRLAEVRGDLSRQLMGQLVDASLAAVSTLVDLMKPPTSAAVRRAAARDVLEYALRAREQSEFENRLRALEESLP